MCLLCQTKEQIVDVFKTNPQERFSHRTAEQNADIADPSTAEDIEHVANVPDERICEQIVELPVPQDIESVIDVRMNAGAAEIYETLCFNPT